MARLSVHISAPAPCTDGIRRFPRCWSIMALTMANDELADRIVWIAEALVLMLFTLGTAELVRRALIYADISGELRQLGLGFVVLAGLVWGLVSAWWLVIRTRPGCPLPVRLPWAIVLGLVATLCMIAVYLYAFHSRFGFQLSEQWFVYAIFAFPLAVVLHRLVTLLRRKSLASD